MSKGRLRIRLSGTYVWPGRTGPVVWENRLHDEGLRSGSFLVIREMKDFDRACFRKFLGH